MTSPDAFSPAVQGVFLSLSDASMSMSHAALGLTVTLLDSLLERVVLLILQQRRQHEQSHDTGDDDDDDDDDDNDDDDDCARRVVASLVLPIDAARIDVAAARSATGVGLLDFSPNLVRDRVRALAADDAGAAATSATASRRTVRVELSDAALRRVACLLHVVTERLLGDAVHLMRRSGAPGDHELAPQHVQVACELEPSATLLRTIASPISDTLLDDFGDDARRSDELDAPDALLASAIVSHDATDALSVRSEEPSLDVNNFLQTAGITRDHWSSNASQASSMAPAPPPPPASLQARVWRFVFHERIGVKHLLCIVILDVLLARLLQFVGQR